MNWNIPPYLYTGWSGKLIGLALLVFFFNFFMRRILHSAAMLFAKKNAIWKSTFFEAVISPLALFIWFFATASVLLLIDEKWNAPPFVQDDSFIYSVGIVLFATWFAFRWKKMLLQKFAKKSKKGEIVFDVHKLDAIDKIVTIGLFFLSATALLQASGQSAATLLTLGGVGVAAVGFASKEFIANFFGGFMIYLTRPFSIGDMIQLPQKEILGTVEEIGWYMTQIRNMDKQPIFIPNATFSQVVITTPSRRSHFLIKEVIGIRYQDYPLLAKILQEVRSYLEQHPSLDHELRQGAHFSSYADSSLDFTVFTYVTTTNLREFLNIKEEVLLAIGDIVKKEGADFPFPTYTLEMSHTPKPE